jgi:hypothetical protein
MNEGDRMSLEIYFRISIYCYFINLLIFPFLCGEYFPAL